MSAIFSKTAVSTSSAGLRKKPTYEELIKYIQDDPDTIRYPNRDAAITSNSFEFNKLVGEGFRQMAMMSDNANDKAREEVLLNRYGASEGMDLGKIEALRSRLGLSIMEHPSADELDDLPDIMTTFASSNTAASPIPTASSSPTTTKAMSRGPRFRGSTTAATTVAPPTTTAAPHQPRQQPPQQAA